MIIPENLLKGRRALDGFPQYNLLLDWTWNEEYGVWFIKFSITLELRKLDNVTYWTAIATKDYPKGKIDIYPDYILGINDTYPHQSNNGHKDYEPLCKSGKICLDEPLDKFFNKKHDEHEKLAWYVERLIHWINDADKNNLLKSGDYFESPDIKISTKGLLIYDEDYFSIEVRYSHEAQFGFVEIAQISDIYIVKRFIDHRSRLVYGIAWGKQIQEKILKADNLVGAWILLDKPITVNTWQTPTTYDQLRLAFSNQGMSFRLIFQKLAVKIRDGKRHFLLLGYPSALKVGDEADNIVWQTILLPALSRGDDVPNGFRKNETGWLQQDIVAKLQGKNKVIWIKSENWSASNIMSRGSLDRNLCRMRLLIIGVGSLGSMIAEMLIRSGIISMTVIDSDTFHAGNLSRHFLDIDSIELKKAEETAKRLNKINPHAMVEYFNGDFDTEYTKNLSAFDIIFDCSGDDSVLEILSKTNGAQWFCSTSFSFEVSNIYLYIGKLTDFSLKVYEEKFGKLIAHENSKYDLGKLPWEGIGCWSPVFPATHAEISIAASIIVSTFDRKYGNKDSRPLYSTYAKQIGPDGIFSGVIRLDENI